MAVTNIVFFNLKTAAILDLWVQYGLIYLKDTRNELLDTKSPRKTLITQQCSRIFKFDQIFTLL